MGNQEEISLETERHLELHRILDNACLSYGYGANKKNWAGLDVYFLNGYIFCGVYKDKIFVNTGADLLKSAINREEDVEEFADTEKPGLGHYLLLRHPVCNDPDRLKAWLDKSHRFILSQPPVLCKHFTPTLGQLFRAKIKESALTIPVRMLLASLTASIGIRAISGLTLFNGAHMLLLVQIFVPLVILSFGLMAIIARFQVKILRTHDLFIIFSENHIFVHRFNTHKTEKKNWDWITGITVTENRFEFSIDNNPLDRLTIFKQELCREETGRLQDWLKQHVIQSPAGTPG